MSDRVELDLAVRFVYISLLDNYVMFQINQLAQNTCRHFVKHCSVAHKGNVESHARYILDAWMLTTTKLSLTSVSKR